MFLELSALCVTLVLLTAVTSGWGVLARHILKMDQSHALRADTLWLGLIFLMGTLSVVHLLLPVGWYVRGLFIVLGGVGLCLARERLRKDLGATIEVISRNRVVSIFFLLMLLVLCLKSLQAPRNFDSALYHFQTIRWLSEFSIIPGLGNLHGRLAFNQSHFSFLALLDIQPITTKGYAAGGLYLLLLALYSILTIYKRLELSGFGLVWALLVGLGLCLDGLSSPTPDVAISILQIQMFLYVVLVVVPNRLSSQLKFELFIVVVALAYFIFTVKISALVFSVACAAIMLPVALRFSSVQWQSIRRLSALLFLFVGVHFVRGYVLSGAPLFPSTFAAAWTLPWAMLPENVLGEAVWIYSWARLPGGEPATVLGNWNWITPWLSNLPRLAWLFFYTSVFLITVDLLLLVVVTRTRKILWGYILYTPLLATVAFWFFTAPDFRFLGAIPVLLVGLPLLLIGQKIVSMRGTPSRVLRSKFSHMSYVAPIIASLILVYFVGIRSITFKMPAPLPVASTNVKTSNFGVRVFEATDGLCWDSAVPCTPFLSMGLKYVDPNRGLLSGFTLR
jgi:hypothetical protein